MIDSFALVQRYLLHERDREVRKVLGIGKKEILTQFITDLYSLPGSGGSDERQMAREWLERSNQLFLNFARWEKRDEAFSNFSVPTIGETKELIKLIESKSIR